MPSVGIGPRLALACVLGSSACTLVTAATDLDSRSHQDSRPAATDGGSVPGDAGVDAAGEGGTGTAEGGGSSSCSSPSANVMFCDDFDHGELGRGWDALDGVTGTIALANDSAYSSPFSLVADFPATTDYATGRFLRATLPQVPFQSIRCDFRYSRDVIGGSTLVTIFLLRVETSAGQLSASLRADVTASQLLVGFPPPDGGPEKATVAAGIDFDPGVFRHVGVELTRTHANVYVDGVKVAFVTHPVAAAPIRAHLSLGPQDAKPNSAPWRFRFDDVVCERSP